MKKAIAVSLLLAIALFAVPASASPPDQVTFVSTMSLSAAAGTFEAFGPAVDAGTICPFGEVYDLSYRAAGYQSNTQLNLFVHKLFVCANDSGTFEMDLNVRIVFSQDTTAKWRVVSGDGLYARLHGNGKLTAQFVDEDHLIDTYVGRLHID